ncbi:ATP-binding cassette sub-family G member 1-like [Chironomus tepperi]|uniref:ATP-binding cassette sub-family G member 1-like n=1 Tax=Chironomus tepperi TaxID=113505 RepID=UPI00391F816B
MKKNHENELLKCKGSFKLAFKDLKYCIKSQIPFIKNETKTILNSISGEFHGNELTAIIGLSGSGKSSLLDCLSGFRQNNVTGTITYNDNIISTRSIKQVSSYFMQEQMLHLYLTVNELMNFAINIKCRQKLNKEEKKTKIEEILQKLKITDRRDTFIRDLSGGERKRFQIAIELVDDPQILFLDEPTTNLDIVASTQCIQFLKDITKEGRTIIFTIHQPCASMLHLFDHIYALNNGNCIYQGSSENLIPFFEEIGLPCPSTYNPTDFLMEIANNDYGDHSHLLIEKIQNGSNLNYRKDSEQNFTADIFKRSSDFKEFSSSYFQQVYYLMYRLLLTTMRNRSLLTMRLIVHIFFSLILGIVYQNVGNNASMIRDDYYFLMILVTVVLYTSYHSHYVTFPLEFPIVKREHFNGWYSSNAYYSSLMIFDAPIVFTCVTICITIAYLMTGQLLEIHRYLILLGLCLLTSYVAQALAVLLTSVLKVEFSLVFGTYLLMPFFLLSNFSIFSRDAHPILKNLFDMNFFNMAFKGSVNSVLGLNRTKLPCDDFYCHFADPKRFLHHYECDVDFMPIVYLLLVYYIICQTGAFILIRYRLKYKQS